MANNLPTEIIDEEILPKLPAKSLFRFKCVSKSFKTLISSPNFIDHHLRHSLSTATATARDHYVIVNLGGDRGGLHTYDLDSPQLPPSPLPSLDRFKSLGRKCTLASSNGLLLITHYNHSKNLIISPFTGFYKLFRRRFELELGFGYDPMTNDYKLLVLERGSFMIYSLTNESLHSIPGDELTALMIAEIFKSRKFAVVINHCFCHWLVWCTLQKKYRLFCLDLSTEKWTLEGLDLPLPLKYKTRSLHYAELLFGTCRARGNKFDGINLAVFEGCLSVSTRNVTCHNNIDVWVMKVYGVAESWVKLFKITDEWLVPLCYSKRSKSRVLVQKRSGDGTSRLVWYNVDEKKFENAEIHSTHGVDRLYNLCMFTGSLVMVPGGRQIR